MTETVKAPTTQHGRMTEKGGLTFAQRQRLRLVRKMALKRGDVPPETIEDAERMWNVYSASSMFDPEVRAEKTTQRALRIEFKGAYWCVLCERNVFPRAPWYALRKRCPICGGVKFRPADMEKPAPAFGVSK